MNLRALGADTDSFATSVAQINPGHVNSDRRHDNATPQDPERENASWYLTSPIGMAASSANAMKWAAGGPG